VTGNWYFARKSSFKAGYIGEIIDRSHRDAITPKRMDSSLP
jgi:hypothetical protein